LKNTKSLKFYLLAILPMLFWGVSYVWVKVVFQYYGPITTTFLRLLISGCLMLVLTIALKKFDKIRKQDYLLFFGFILIDPVGYFLCESFGLTHVSALIASIIISTIPLFSVIVGSALLKEKLTPLNFAGAVISFIGIGFMVLKGDLTFIASPLGILLIFGAVFCAVIYSVIVKRLASRYSGLTIITIQNCFGALYFLPLFFFFEYKDFVKVSPNFELVSNLILLAVLGSSLAFIMYIYVISKIGIGRANMYVNLISVFTLLASYFILKEQMTFKNIIGMLIVITGLYLSQIRKEKAQFN
jgi:drug/metabolite transporter (DMT)-like permease